MKKVLVFCLLTVFSAFYAVSAWGEVVPSISGTILTLSYSGSGSSRMTDYKAFDGSSTPKRPTAWSSITKVVIEDGVTHVGQYAFHSCTSLTSVEIPTSVTSFGEGAFKNTSSSAKYIYYAGTPNEWANIDFEVTGTYAYSHPFYGGTSSTHHFYFYNQKTTETKEIVFAEGLTTIKSYTFYYAGNITDVYIPHSVTNIQTKAFIHCGNLARITVLNTSAPEAATDAFENMLSTSYLYVPSGANGSTSAPGFKCLPWYDSSSSGKGAKYIGASGTDKSYTTDGNNFGTGKVYPLSGSITNATWSLSLEGVLTITGNGELPSTFVGGTYTSDNILPWARFRRMVNKVIVIANGTNITSLGNSIEYCYAIESIKIQQTTIPTGTYSVVNNYKNSSDVVTLYVNPDLLLTAKSNAPWNNDRIKLALNDKIVINEASNNTALLTALHDEVVEPFTMQFTRSLTNASYNTFCSPVPLTAAQLGGADIRALESTTYDDGSEELYLNFSSTPLSAIEAGVPYLIQPSSAISNPTFTNVEPNSIVATASFVNTDHVKFHGVLAPTSLTGGDKNTLFLGAGNELFWPEATGNIKGLRAYFEVKEGSGARRALRARMSMDGHNTPTDFESIQTSAVRSQKVLRDGKLYIMHNGQMYDVQGRRL